MIRHPLKAQIVYKMPCRWNVQLISGKYTRNPSVACDVLISFDTWLVATGAKCLDRSRVLPGLDDFNCSCEFIGNGAVACDAWVCSDRLLVVAGMPPKLLHGNGGSFTKPNQGQGHEMAVVYRHWRDTPPDMAALGAGFVAQPVEALPPSPRELGLLNAG